VVQTAAKLVLEPIFEADFEDNAYGYEPAYFEMIPLPQSWPEGLREPQVRQLLEGSRVIVHSP
jgi:hypothetical protein